MNSVFYRSLLLSGTFFRVYSSLKYHHVPVARAMFYSFHRMAMRRAGGKNVPRRWARQKRLLYSRLIRKDPVRKITYGRRQVPGKTIFSPYSIQGLPVPRSKAIVCGQSAKERKLAHGRPLVVPARMAKLNNKSYRILMRRFTLITRRRSTPRMFKSRQFRRWFSIQLRQTMKMIDGIRKLFAKNRINGVVLHSSVHPLGYLLVHMAKQRGVPTFITQYGINDDYQLFSTYARYYIAWGKSHRRRLTQFGVPAKKFHLLGSARFDPIFKGRWKNKKQLARTHRFSARKLVFLYPEQPLAAWKNKKAMRIIINAMRPFQRKAFLLVKPHPRQRTSTLSLRERRKWRFIRVIGKRTSLYDLISGSNAVLVQFSTVGIEAMLLNRPVIAMAFFQNTAKHEFTYYSASKRIASAIGTRQLRAIIRKIIHSRKYRRRLSIGQRVYRNHSYQGKLSAYRIYRFIRTHLRR